MEKAWEFQRIQQILLTTARHFEIRAFPEPQGEPF